MNSNRTVVLVFKRSELLYDASNYSFLEADIMKGDDEYLKHQVFDIDQNGNVDRVTRVLNLAHAECVEMLFPYTNRETETNEIDDTLTSPEFYRIEMSIPCTFSATTIELLKNLIHEYLICRVLEDWMSITKPESQSNWREKLEAAKRKIQVSLTSRGKVLRRKQSPF